MIHHFHFNLNRISVDNTLMPLNGFEDPVD